MTSLLLAFIGLFSSFLPRVCARLAWVYFCTPINKTPVNYDLFPPKYSSHTHQIDGEEVVSYHWVPDYHHSTCCVVHGWGGYTGSMRRLIEEMLRRQIAVVAVDITAHGASTGNVANLASYRNCLSEIWMHYKQINSFVGHSIGGTAISLLASSLTQHPNSSRLQSMVMVSSPNSIEAMADRFLMRIQADTSAKPWFIRQIENVANLPIKTLTITRFLETVKTENVMVIHDEFDEVIPYEEACSLYKAYPDLSFVTTQNLAHNRIYRDKKVIENIVSFIESKALT